LTQFHDIPFDAVVRAQFFFTQSTGKTGSFKLYWLYDKITSIPSNADLVAFANLGFTAWGSAIAPHCAGATILTKVHCKDLTSETAAVGEHTASMPGTSVGFSLSPEVTVLVNFLTQRAYRGGKPRCNFPMGVQGDLDTDGEHWKSTSLSTFGTAVTSFLNTLNANTNMANPIHIVASYFKGAQVNPNPSVWAPRNVPAPRVDAAGVAKPLPIAVVSHSVNPKSGILRERAATN
jgi:hypothetical protein